MLVLNLFRSSDGEAMNVETAPNNCSFSPLAAAKTAGELSLKGYLRILGGL